MKDLIQWVIEHKTYLASVFAAVVNLAIILGWLGELSADKIVAIEAVIAAIFGASIRHDLRERDD